MTNTDLTVLLKTVLDKSDMKAEIKKIQAIINKYPIKITPELDSASIKKQIKSLSSELDKKFSKTFNINIKTNNITPIQDKQNSQNAESNDGKKDTNFLKGTIDTATDISNTFDKVNKLKKNFDWFCNKNYLKIA